MSDKLFGDASMDLGFGADPPRLDPEPKPGAAPATVTLTQEQFDALLAKVGETRQAVAYTEALTGQTPKAPEPAAPVVDLSALPNPATDPEGFQASLQDVLEQVVTRARDDAVAGATRHADTVVDRERLANEAWDMLRTEYPDVARFGDLVSNEVSRITNDLIRRGYDPYVELARDMPTAVKTIASGVQKTLDQVLTAHGAGGGDTGRIIPDRSDVLGAGAGRLQAPGRQATAAPSSLIDDLRKLQRDQGIY